jgi:GPH family glycoside/pentoside/hexuronide:cation symporter
MSKTTPTITSKVPFRYKVAFGVGMLANQMFPASLGIFMVVLVQNLGFPGWMWGIVYFLPRISDALTDPIMGFISDNTKSKWGRRRQYVILGGVIMAIAFAIMWQLYGENSVNYNFTYFLLFSFAFYIGLTIFSVPYVAIGYEMSDDFHERTQIMAIAQWIGQWAWVIAPWFWVIMYDPDWFPTAEGATRQLAVWVAVVFGFCALVPGLFIPSKSTLGENYSPLTFNAIGSSLKKILRGFIEAFSSKPFRMGKKRAFILSQGISIVGYVLLWFLFIPGKPYMFIFALPFFSFGIGSLFTLMMSMTADVIDLDELNTGKRREGIFGAIYWWMVKLGFAIAGGLSGIILTAVGFNADLGVQTESAIFGLRAFYSGVPILGTMIAILVMWHYDMTEEKANEIRKEIARIKATKKSTANFIRNKLQTLDEKFKGVPLIDLSNKSDSEMRALVTDRLNKGVHGLCFSPYEENQQLGDILSREQIRRRIEIVKPSTSWVRSFSCSDGNELIPEVAHELGLKTMAGAWISRDHKKSQQEIDTLVKLAEKGCVDIAVVGNEVLLREDLKENEIINYILKVRSVIPSHIPVGYVDAYYQFIERPALIDACDLVLANCYPFWEGINNDVAAFSVQRMYELTKEKAKGKRVIITETGWPGKGGQVGDALPSEENAMKFFINIQKWATDKDVELFYFTSFDEPWKVAYEGEVGGQWGLWNKNEILKYQ